MLQIAARGVQAISNDQRLDGWKAIANFLGRERSTAIRWANERGLPVHRVPGGQTGTVYAISSELNGWLAGDRKEVPAGHHTRAEDSRDVQADLSPTPVRSRKLAAMGALVATVIMLGSLVFAYWRWFRTDNPPVSIAAVVSPGANRETLEFARGLNADLARFTNASPDLAVFESEPGRGLKVQYAIRTEIEDQNGKMVANARLTATKRGQVVWSRRFEQSGPALSSLREQIAANIVDVLRCSFGGLGTERQKVQPADLEQLIAICQSFELSDYGSAAERARQLTLSNPDLSLGWALLAMIQGEMVGQGNTAVREQALSNSRRAAMIAPDGLNTWLAKIAASVGGPTSPEALPIVEAALRTHPDEPWLLYDRSIILFNLGYVQSSIADVLRAVHNDPSSFTGRDTAVRRLAAAGRTGEALQLQAENERLWVGHPQVMANRNRIAPTIPRSHDAEIAEIAKYEREFPTSPSDAYMLARLYERTGNRQAALDWLARAPVDDALQQWSLLFWPDAVGLRTEPAFFRKMAELGLVRRWVAHRAWPDFCAEAGLKYNCAAEAERLSNKATAP